MTDALQTKQALKGVFAALDRGELSYDEAKRKAQPLIDELNVQIRAKTAELNKKYGMKRKPAVQDFINLRRSQGLL